MKWLTAFSVTALALGLGACGSAPKTPTLADLAATRSAEPEPTVELPASRGKAIDAYRAFLDDAPETSPLRAEAIRRLADLRQESLDDKTSAVDIEISSQAQASERQAIITLYSNLLRRYPDNPRNPEAMYQLGRAYEAAGERERALETMERLVRTFPDSPRFDEVQFRRGEMLYVDQRYGEAESAYRAVIAAGPGSAFYDQALYKGGWSLFKQRRFDAALDLFITVLDRRVENDDIDLDALSRVERERVLDTLRVISHSFSYQAGAASMADYFGRRGARPYEHLMYRTLGEQHLDKERYSDAAATFAAFVARHPLHREAPRLQLQVIAAYQAAGFAGEVLDAKRRFVAGYGMDQPYWSRFTREQAPDIVAEVKSQLDELSRHYHAEAQATKTAAAYQEAIRWYRRRLTYFPGEADSANANFLLAELLFETRQFADAAQEYERTAYDYPDNAKAAEAGYAALLAHAAHEQGLARAAQPCPGSIAAPTNAIAADGSGQCGLTPAQRAARQHTLASSERFVERFPDHPESPKVLAKMAEQLFAAGDGKAASWAAQRLVGRYPQTDPALRRSAWLVIAHSAFDGADYAYAESGYGQALALTGAKAQDRTDLVDRLGASVYKQAEQLRVAGDLPGAAAGFLRVAQVAPTSSIRPTADYDAAAAYLEAKQWPQAARVLEAFRRDYPQHPLQAQVTEKLAVAYLEAGNRGAAANEFTRIAQQHQDVDVRREAAWQAAELYEQEGQAARAIAAWAHYVNDHARPAPEAIEARYRLLRIAEQQGDRKQARSWRNAIIEADREAGAERTDRTRYLAAHARLALARDEQEVYAAIRLTEPLKRSLERKRRAMKGTLAALTAAADYNVAGVTTEATFRSGEVYRQFAQSLLNSQRPKKLNAEEKEEYDLLLEEQAFPFEEKAIEVHAINTRRTLDGVYDEWVRNSYRRLAELMPVRYKKGERNVDVYAALD